MIGTGRTIGIVAVLLAISSATAIGSSSAAPAHAADPTPASTLRYWATVDNPFPKPGPTRTAMVIAHFTDNGVGIAGVRMASIWRGPLGRQFCYGKTGSDGVATCTRLLTDLQLGSAVQISVTFYYRGATYGTSTSLLPE